MDVEVLDGKYKAMTQGGADRLRSGVFDLWQGLPAKDAPNQILAAHFHPNPALENLCLSVALAATKCGIDLCLAGRDFPFHVTIQQGVPDSKSVELPPSVIFCHDLLGQTIQFGYVITGPNILVTSSLVPEVITNCRATVSKVMTECHVTPSEISILHATVARITSLSDAGKLPEFVSLLSNLDELVKIQPLQLTVSHLTFGTVEELLNLPAMV